MPGSIFNFISSILPRYIRKSANIEAVVPLLYLKGPSGNAFKEALGILLGKDGMKGLSVSSISTMKKSWVSEMKEWSQSKITDEFVYLWCDGVNVSKDEVP